MKRWNVHLEDSCLSVNTESRDKFNTSQRFVITLTVIVSTAFVISVIFAPIPTLVFFGFSAVVAAFLVGTIRGQEKEYQKWMKMYE